MGEHLDKERYRRSMARLHDISWRNSPRGRPLSTLVWPSCPAKSGPRSFTRHWTIFDLGRTVEIAKLTTHRRRPWNTRRGLGAW